MTTTIPGPSEILLSTSIPRSPSPMIATGHHRSIVLLESSVPVASKIPKAPSVSNTSPIQSRTGFMSSLPTRTSSLHPAIGTRTLTGPFVPPRRGLAGSASTAAGEPVRHIA